MMPFSLQAFPPAWLIEVELTSSQRDKYGDPSEQAPSRVQGCLLAVSTTADSRSNSDVTEVKANLYLPAGTEITSQHLVESFPGAPVEGLWAVVGEPVHWPMGVEVELRKEAADA